MRAQAMQEIEKRQNLSRQKMLQAAAKKNPLVGRRQFTRKRSGH